jgi:hypothetical protein
MGGFGSGRHGGGRFTDDMRALDVRKIHRAGMLALGRSLTWRWTCNDQTTGAISINVEADRVRLSYRRQPEGGECESMNYAVRVDWTPCALGGRRVWWLLVAVSCCRLRSARGGAARRPHVRVLPVLPDWRTEASVRPTKTGPRARPTRSGNGWAGNRAS